MRVLAYTYIPASVGYTILQLNAVWTVFIGIVFFKEVDIKKYWQRVCAGIVFSAASVILLLFAQFFYFP